MPTTLQTLNTAAPSDALDLLEPLVEMSPWVASAVIDQRPFRSIEDLASALVEVILRSAKERRISLFQAHAELAGAEAVAGQMTAHSQTEQGRLGLTSLSGAEAELLARMNAEYCARFGHPFIIALHRVPDRAALFKSFERRLGASPLEEHVTTLSEITSVILSRTGRSFETDQPLPQTSLRDTQE